MKKWMSLVLFVVLITVLATASASASTITVELFDRNNVPSDQGTTLDNRWTRYIQESVAEELGITVEYQLVPRSEEESQLNILMAAGSAPDIVFTYNRTLLMKYAMEGGLSDLTPYMEGMDNLYALSARADSLSYGIVDGKQYAIPASRADLGHIVPWIRADWVEKVGMELPTNRDELVEVLRAFRDMNPSESESGTIPWAGSLISMDGFYMQDVAHSFCENTEEELYCLPLPARPGYKEFAAWMNGLYQEGLIDTEFATHDDNLIRMKENLAGFFMEGWWVPGNTGSTATVCNVLAETNPEAKLMAVDVFQSKDGSYFKTCYQPIGLYLMVPTTAKDPEACVKYLNWLASLENGMLLGFGVEGEHYDMVDGVPTTIDAEYNNHTRNPSGDLMLPFNGYPFDDAIRDKVFLTKYAPFGELSVNAFHVAMNDAVSEISFQIPLETDDMYGVELLEAYKAGWVKLMTADDFETAWADYWADLTAKGIQEVITERTEYYNTYVLAE